MSRDTTRQQLFEACNQNRVAAQLLDYFMNVHALKLRKNPDAEPHSSELWMDFARGDLAAKLMVSDKTVRRAILCLVERRFITVHKVSGMDRTNRYELHRSLVETVFQPLPLFESVASSEVDHMDKMTECIRSKCPDASGHFDRMHSVKMTGCISLPLPSSSFPSPSAGADAASEIEIQTRPATEPSGLPDVAEQQAEDAEREGLLEQLRSIGIAQEYAEAHLSRHTRQKLQAALACLAIDRRSKPIRSEAGYVLGFLADPQKYGYDLDAQGCWRSSKELFLEEKRRRQARSRDSPALDPRQAAYVAWDRLSSAQQLAIRQAIQQQHPDISPALLMQRCREQALNITREAPCPKQP